MFGVLDGSNCTMVSEDRYRWMGHICGVCLSLRDNYGQAARIATNCDAALISVLCEAQCQKRQKKYTSRCPLRRLFKAKVYFPSSPGAQFGALMSLLIAATKIEDHIEDSETFLKHVPGISTRIAQKWKQAAQRTANTLEFDANMIEAQARQQREAEAQPSQDFFFYAKPTELSVGVALRHTAVIANRLQNADVLLDIGQLFGRIIYLLDSYRDYAMDSSLNKFNALVACFAKEKMQWETRRIFHQAYHGIKHLFNQLDLPQPSLARALLTRQLGRTGYRTLKINECTICSRDLSNGSTLAVLNQGTASIARDTEEELDDWPGTSSSGTASTEPDAEEEPEDEPLDLCRDDCRAWCETCTESSVLCDCLECSLESCCRCAESGCLGGWLGC